MKQLFLHSELIFFYENCSFFDSPFGLYQRNDQFSRDTNSFSISNITLWISGMLPLKYCINIF